MSNKHSKVPYKCSFCRERLVPTEMSWLDSLRILMLCRLYQCPHCFNCVFRPFSWIGRLPLIGRLFGPSAFTRAAARSGPLSPKDAAVGGSITWAVARLGRWVQNCERRLFGAVAWVFRMLWAIIWFFPSLVFGRKRKPSQKFLS